jgi:hypothetical protein
MPSAYQLYRLNKWPAESSFRTNEQLNLLADNEYNIEETTTEVTASTSLEIDGVPAFDAVHDFLFHLDHPGRARGNTFREFVTPYHFTAFLAESGSIPGRKGLLVRTKKKVAQDFVGRLNRFRSDFVADQLSIAFEPLRPRLPLIRGAWFGAMRAPNLASTGVFGHHVDQSEEFRHADSLGDLTNLLVEHVVDGQPHTLMLTADAGIILYNAYAGPAEELAVVRAVIDELLAGAIADR